ncbi:hypothetical protein N1027_06090 [Herbiconiux sp. CPCC 205763]|uniref:Uncharacterized protein n=1 Tax=Herbiconiux aconitum TaxID=2970913 RepID=A0ABT2GN96_9MICO|nr:hypothetical protein [Herbiconiux aconitum]MCS5717703.1 hypothetical protein [Herbiconiux aconitum]
MTTIRELTSFERELLSLLVLGDWEGAEAAREQLRLAKHAGPWTSGSQSFHVDVESGSPLVSLPDGLLNNTERAVHDGDDCIGGVMLWLQAGRISGFEYYWVTDDPPLGLPTLKQVRHMN